VINHIKDNKMEHISKLWTWLLDGASGTTFLYGFLTGQDILMILGGIASFMAIINHGQQFFNNRKKRK